jgi:AraC-like DNA-binding protein
MPRRSPYIEIIENELLPGLARDEGTPLITALPQYGQMKGQAGVHVSPNPRKGARQVKRGYNYGRVKAYWKEDRLLESYAPLLIFVYRGEADLRCGDYILHVPQGKFLLIPAGVPRSDGSASLLDVGDNPKRYADTIVFLPRGSNVEIWLNHDRGNEHIRPQPNESILTINPELPRLLNYIEDETKEKRHGYEPIVTRTLEVFLRLVLRELQEEKAFHPRRQPNPLQSGDEAHNPITQAQDYIREHLQEHLTQESMAAKVRLSRTQFINRFRNETGQTFNQFVIQCRLEQAKLLLHTTDLPVNVIGAMVGYQTSGYFYRMFQRETGLRPTEFREQNNVQ